MDKIPLSKESRTNTITSYCCFYIYVMYQYRCIQCFPSVRGILLNSHKGLCSSCFRQKPGMRPSPAENSPFKQKFISTLTGNIYSRASSLAPEIQYTNQVMNIKKNGPTTFMDNVFSCIIPEECIRKYEQQLKSKLRIRDRCSSGTIQDTKKYFYVSESLPSCFDSFISFPYVGGGNTLVRNLAVFPTSQVLKQCCNVVFFIGLKHSERRQEFEALAQEYKHEKK